MNLDLDKGIYRGKKLDIVVDFDGTCVSHEFPNVGKSIGSESVLHELVANGHNLILFTMRSNQGELPLISKNGKRKWQKKISANYLDDAVKWFEKNNIPLYGVQKNPTQKKWTTSPKAYGQLIIDDAALGTPLTFDLQISSRPFVDWRLARKELVRLGVLN